MATLEDNTSETHHTVSLMDEEYKKTRDKYSDCLKNFNEFMVTEINSRREN